LIWQNGGLVDERVGWLAVVVTCSEARLVAGRIGGVYSLKTSARQDTTQRVDSVENLPAAELLKETDQMIHSLVLWCLVYNTVNPLFRVSRRNGTNVDTTVYQYSLLTIGTCNKSTLKSPVAERFVHL